MPTCSIVTVPSFVVVALVLAASLPAGETGATGATTAVGVTGAATAVGVAGATTAVGVTGVATAVGAADAVTTATAVSAASAATSSRSGYLRPVIRITPARGCVVLTAGMTGIKVKLVQHRLGMPAGTWAEMDSDTIRRVAAFQRGRHLAANGVVGLATWRAMGFHEDFCLDRWRATPALPLWATSAQRVATMISYAATYLRHDYVWGGAGQPRYGVDCSGLVPQSLYRAGLDPQPISVDKHVLPTLRTSAELYAHPRLHRLPRAQMRRGDLLFYTSNSTGRINHVAIYLGGGRMLEAVEPAVRISAVVARRSTQTIARDVVRPFN